MQIPTSALQDITTKSLSTSSKPEVSLQSNRSPRALAWVGSSNLPPQLLRPHPPVPLHQQRFRRLPPPRTTYGHLEFSPNYSAIRGRPHRPEPHRRTASQSSPRPPLYPSPRRRIASQASPRPSLCSRSYYRLASPRFRLSTLRSRPLHGIASRRSRRPPLCPRPRPRRSIASRRSRWPPLC